MCIAQHSYKPTYAPPLPKRVSFLNPPGSSGSVQNLACFVGGENPSVGCQIDWDYEVKPTNILGNKKTGLSSVLKPRIVQLGEILHII